MRFFNVISAILVASYAESVAAQCRGQPSQMWRCLRSDNSNSGYTQSCCPGGGFMENGACCTANWSGFASCCRAHESRGYWAANG
ncbi:hypothetical protein F5X68DRAFT_196252 [Plectosphaerella plurivora]|uniref:Uncharacterized protein n=1 Tax=Plectosphaerella plurivora TaxID=936078 RepID=A0A9P8VLZ0_9PEZI|nr:hypothetical protein F5X68DRAFT_196252 [Plectosphaerella plurivora]